MYFSKENKYLLETALLNMRRMPVRMVAKVERFLKSKMELIRGTLPSCQS